MSSAPAHPNQEADIPKIADILSLAAREEASDIILTVGTRPQFKIRGVYTTFEQFPELTPTTTRILLYGMMSEQQQTTFEREHDLDFAFPLARIARFRVNVFLQRNSVAGVLRLIPTNIKTLAELNMPQVVTDVTASPRGLVLVTGPTGSGKSTTLAAMIDHINVNKKLHIVTIEDPVEFLHRHKSSVVNQREIGADTGSFARALKSALRQAPDVILVGEMRDHETIKAAISAAETGHLVMGTLHTNSAPESVDRIIDVFPEEQQEQIRTQLASNLVAVVTQQLVPAIDGKRAMAMEIMVVNNAIRALIREGKVHQIVSIMQTTGASGNVTMDAALAELYRQRIITHATGLEKAVDSKEFARLASQQGPNVPRQMEAAQERPAAETSRGGYGRG